MLLVIALSFSGFFRECLLQKRVGAITTAKLFLFILFSEELSATIPSRASTACRQCRLAGLSRVQANRMPRSSLSRREGHWVRIDTICSEKRGSGRERRKDLTRLATSCGGGCSSPRDFPEASDTLIQYIHTRVNSISYKHYL